MKDSTCIAETRNYIPGRIAFDTLDCTFRNSSEFRLRYWRRFEDRPQWPLHPSHAAIENPLESKAISSFFCAGN